MKNIIFALLFSLSLNAQTAQRVGDFLVLDGVEYLMKGEMLNRYKDARSGDSFNRAYSDTDLNNVGEIADAFIRDAMINGAWIDGIDGVIEVVSRSWWDCSGTGPSEADIYTSGCRFSPGDNVPAGTAYGRYSEGYNIRLRNTAYSYLDTMNRFELVYHELGHALLHLKHSCSFPDIMNDGAFPDFGTEDNRYCYGINEFEFTEENVNYYRTFASWRPLVRRMFTSTEIYYGSPRHPRHSESSRRLIDNSPIDD